MPSIYHGMIAFSSKSATTMLPTTSQPTTSSAFFPRLRLQHQPNGQRNRVSAERECHVIRLASTVRRITVATCKEQPAQRTLLLNGIRTPVSQRHDRASVAVVEWGW
jgi:hypothetical protein